MQNERSRKVKQVLVGKYGQGNVSVQKGKGTAHDWLYVKISLPASEMPKRREARLSREGAVRDEANELVTKTKEISLASYLQDIGPQSGWEPCLRVEVVWK